ncbi:transglutaminase-like domain-containing protein [Candidatus Woesearchaeota archaeon]|nr:transglutaminase-like domain-containing protein [Candidatus Woesearchaeota archaeon]
MVEEKKTEDIPEPEPWYRSPLKYIIMVFLLLLIVMWYFPKESIKLDPEPAKIPTIDEVLPPGLMSGNQSKKIIHKNDYYNSIQPDDPTIKQIAGKIAAISCDGNQVCQAKAVYYFVRDNFDYVKDPYNKEYIETPLESLFSGSMDCDGHAVLLGTLEESIGIEAQLVFIPSHAFVRVYLPEALKRYRKGSWIYLDATCKDCVFGELPLQDKDKRETYLDIT